MRDYEEIKAMVAVLEDKQTGIIERYERITGTPVLDRSPGDKVFMMNGGGTRECQTIIAQLSAIAWVLELS